MSRFLGMIPVQDNWRAAFQGASEDEKYFVMPIVGWVAKVVMDERVEGNRLRRQMAVAYTAIVCGPGDSVFEADNDDFDLLGYIPPNCPDHYYEKMAKKKWEGKASGGSHG